MAQGNEGQDGAGASAPQVLTFGTESEAVGAPSIGEILADRYQLEEHIGDDSLGRQLYRGVDVILRRPVAMVLRYPGGDSAGEMLTGAVAASRIVHPHLVGVYDAIDEQTRAYVVREWVDGCSLRNLLSEGPLDPSRAIGIAWAVTDAIAALHATGMAHGNVHPGSVLIANDGRVVLADARADDATSPESDVRAIGALLYCGLTAHWPHAEVSWDPLPDAVRDSSGTIVAPRQVRAGVPAYLDELTTDLLNPSLPVPAASALAAELSGLDSSAHNALFDGHGGLDLDAFDQAAVVSDSGPRPGRRKLAVGVGGLLVLALAGTLAAAQVLSDDPAGDPPPGGSTPGAASSQQAPNKLTPVKLAATDVRIVDPKGNGSERRNAAYAIDGKADTSWSTERYNNDPAFGKLKPGMGVWLDLGEPKQVVSVEVGVTQRGATMSLLGGTTDPGAGTAAGDEQILSSYKVLHKATTDVPPKIALNGGDEPVRYLLVWVTSLPPDGDKFKLSISEISVLVQ